MSEPTILELLDQMKREGIEHILPSTGRKVHLRTVDAESLLVEGKMPDVLTPLVIKSIYQEVEDEEIRQWLDGVRESAAEALSHAESVNLICRLAIMDETEVRQLTLAEKRWIFRLVMGSAEMLVTFRYDPNFDVESVSEGDEVRETSESDYEGEEFISELDAG